MPAVGLIRIRVRQPAHPNAIALGKLGGKKGGRARAKKPSRDQRKTIAVKAARARWEKYSYSLRKLRGSWINTEICTAAQAVQRLLGQMDDEMLNR
jgi:hypothetical protein